MLVAGLIRQESTFHVPGGVSHRLLIGLMQVLPKTGSKLAKNLKVKFARQESFDPEYNLRLGTAIWRADRDVWHAGRGCGRL